MYKDFIKAFIKDNPATFVEYGYGQVEPNHLSAKRTGQIYAQLPAAASIDMLQNGQFVKYDYAANENGIGEVNFTGKGEWMLVYNEIKLYHEGQADCEFAMLKDNYQARLYSPVNGLSAKEGQTRFYNGVDSTGNTSATIGSETITFDDVTASADYRDINYNEDPFHIMSYKTAKMPAGTTMVPRVFKTNVGDIFTTNTIVAAADSLAVGDILSPNASGLLEKDVADATMEWQVVKVYTMPDDQPGVKIMRIA